MPILEEYRRCPCILGSDGLLFKKKYIQNSFPKDPRNKKEENFVHINSLLVHFAGNHVENLHEAMENSRK